MKFIDYRLDYLILEMFIALAIFLSPISCSQAKTNVTQFRIKKGVNIGNWLEDKYLKKEQLPYIFTVEDVDKLSLYGFDHVRLPVGEIVILNEDGTLKADVVNLIHQIIQRCNKNNMKVILDLHNIRKHYYIERLKLCYMQKEIEAIAAVWQILMAEFEQYSENLLAYEILNEPGLPKDSQWNSIIKEIVSLIRHTNKKRVIILGSNRWNDVEHVKNLQIPKNDPNIILSFHYYDPDLLTHYRVSWRDFGKLKYDKQLSYPGKLIDEKSYNNMDDRDQKIVSSFRKNYNRNYMQKRWLPAIRYAKAKGLKLYLGEFGCLPNCGEKARLAWLNDVVSLCKKYDIAYSLWEYNSGFGFVDRRTGKLHNQKILDLLVK